MDAVSKFVNAYFNDPAEKDVPLAQAYPSGSVSKFSIAGWPQSSGDFPPGTCEFEWGELAVILARTYDTWSDYFGAAFSWQPGDPLPANPRAGRDLNAYYDRHALKFFYDAEKKTGKTVYASESSDIIAHECGHAVLDAHHPDYWDSLHPETGAFHEAFGDMSALLNTLQYPTVRAAMLKENKGDLSQSNGVSRLAEQLAGALYDKYGASACDPNYLRDLVNLFKYKATWKLPARAPASRLSSESHSFSRVFSGAFYEILVGIYELLRKGDSSLPEDNALVKARDEAGRLLASALLLAPPGDATFSVIAISMLKADQQKSASRYFTLLRQVFVRRRILAAKDADTFGPHTATRNGKTTSVRAQAVSAKGVQADKLPPEVLDKALHLRGEELIFARELGQRTDETRTVQYRGERKMRLRGKKFGVADGALVPVQSGLTLNIDVAGIVAASHFYRAGGDAAKAVRDHVEKLASKDRIYDAKPGDQVDLMHLMTRGQPYFISYDADGNKLVRRAFIACGYCSRRH